MNLLVTSVGRRVKIIEYFKRALKELDRKVIATDCDPKAPALYFADNYEIVPQINSENYISYILQVCKKHNIKGIVSLIDPELEILAKNKEKFEKVGIKLILSPLQMVQNSFDKKETYRYLEELSIPAVPTMDNYEEVVSYIEQEKYEFPLVVKPKKGSASNGLFFVQNIEELKHAFFNSPNMIIQPFYKDREFGIDIYIDMVSGNLVDMFIKEKILMRAGETDKSISVNNREIEKIVSDFVRKANFLGPIDIDCFEKDGKYYISEINPRFGGGYPHAFEMGCNFMEYIVTNLYGRKNNDYKGFKYSEGYVMMKYDDVKIFKQ